VLLASDSGLITAGDQNTTKFGVRVGEVRRDAQRRTVVRSLDLHAELGESRTLGWHVSARQAYPRYFRRPPNVACSHEICPSVCVCVCTNIIAGRFLGNRCDSRPSDVIRPHKSLTQYIMTLPWPGPHSSQRYRRHHAAACTPKVKGKSKGSTVHGGGIYCLLTPCSPVRGYWRFGVTYCLSLLSSDSMYSGTWLLTFRSNLLPQSIVFYAHVVRQIAADVSE
jgi:hypothetical protein